MKDETVCMCGAMLASQYVFEYPWELKGWIRTENVLLIPYLSSLVKFKSILNAITGNLSGLDIVYDPIEFESRCF